MHVKYYYPLWSVQELPLSKALNKISKKGYDGVEIALNSKMDLPLIKRMFEEYGLELLAQHSLSNGQTFESYRSSFSQNLESILQLQPTRVNCHTGRDYYSMEQNLILLRDAEKLALKHEIMVTHEIHRGRFSYSPMLVGPYLDKIPSLRLTADFSHWCVVTESLLHDHQKYLNNVIPLCSHIHARVGNDESPQVNDPFAPEHLAALQQHLKWWKAIYKHHLDLGTPDLPITCEFGPPPYLQTLPRTQEPVASIWDINFEMMTFLKNGLN